jgi:8-oxo-dGTP pyrophosphatase MutT (NUDIX family)
MGRISPVQAEMYYQNSHANAYGPFLPRDSRTFTDGAFGPFSPIQPVPVDEAPPGGLFPDPRWWEYRVGWNLPTPPGTEGLKLASFQQLKVLSERYSVARQCIELRKNEILGLEWEITLTTDAAKAYQGDRKAMRDFGERKAEVTRFFRHPDPDYWSFSTFLDAVLEEIFVYDALAVVFRPKYGASFGMGGRGLLGSDLDSINLVSGPSVRPLIDMHGGRPRPPAPAYQQYLYGVPRSDYMTIATGKDIEDYGLAGAEVNEFRSDVMLYAPTVTRRETPYGFPAVERALLPIISGLQKQEFQLDFFTEGSVPAVYISPGDTNITPTQISELQSALNALAGDPAYHLKVVVLPPGSKVEPQRPVDLSDSFDYLVMNQVAMAFDIQPQELGIIPDIGATSTGPSASAVRFAGQEGRDLKSRKSTKPLLSFLCDIFNYAIQDICQQPDMQFTFEGLVDDEDKAKITELGVEQVQNGIASIDEVRERLDLPPWGLQETSEPVVFTAQGPVPFSMAPQLIMMAAQGKTSASGQGTNSGQNSKTRPSQPAVRAGGQTKPNGSHNAPLAPHREAPATPGHAAAAGAVQSPTPRTGGTTSRNSVAGSRKKAATAELEALKRHLRKGREITSWDPVNITNGTLSGIAEDIAKGVLLDTAISRALDMTGDILIQSPFYEDVVKAERQFPGWEQDLGLAGRYKEEISQAFQDAGMKGSQLRKDAATGKMWVSAGTLHGLISDATIGVFGDVMVPMWRKAWNLGYEGASELLGKSPGNTDDQVQGFIDTEGAHWLDQVSRTGLGNSKARSEIIARTEVARAMNAGAMQCYRDSGVAYKHLGVAPDERSCEICKDSEDDGIIPLDAPFSHGGITGFCHVQCRCVPLPDGIDVEPPLAHIGKRFMTADEARQYFRDSLKDNAPEDESRVAWLLIRARDDDGKWRYLLQQRDDGTWGMPGGTTHIGEDGFHAAFREATEEIGDLPSLNVVRNFNHTDPDGRQAYLYLCEAGSIFTPQMNGSTPQETAGTGWFKRKEISDLDLTDKFRDDWENEVHLEQALKMISPGLSGEILVDPAQNGGGGARWPYPHRADGTEEPWPDAGPGAVPDEHGSAGGEPPHDGNFADRVNARGVPDGGKDDEFPRRRIRNKPASRFPDSDPGEGGMHPSGGIGSGQSPATGIPSGKQETPHPVAGSVPAKTPKPYRPHPEAPVAFDPAETVEVLTPEGNAVYDLPGAHKGASDISDPNPVEYEHVLNMMRSNFPEPAIDWVKRASWIGPVDIPWDRINDSSIDSWAASHQSAKVNEFARRLRADRNSVHPSVVIQGHNGDKVDIIDGHHRALAHKRLDQPVRAYVGTVRNPKDVKAALETHAMQFNSGASPGNE